MSNKTPLLTICVPTYNRKGHTEKLLRMLCDRLLTGQYNVEILLSNNQSKDGTADLEAEFVAKGVRWITQPEFLPTAESHMVACVSECRGEYLWYIGDDDLPQFQHFDWLYRLLESNRYDYMLINAPLVGLDGNISNQRPIIAQREIIEAPIQTIVEATGALFLFGGVTTHIMRRAMLLQETGHFYLETAPIYSQVGWIMDSFKSANCAFLNRPLVLYRETDYSDGHWVRQAEKRNVTDMFFWTTGLMHLLKTMISRGVITHANVGRFLECRKDGSRYRLIDDMLGKIYGQIQTAFKNPADNRQKISEADFAELKAFMLTADGTLYDLWMNIESLYRRDKAGGSFLSQHQAAFNLAFGKHLYNDTYAPFWQQGYRQYEVYHLPFAWVAISTSIPSLRERMRKILEAAEPLAHSANILVSSSEADLFAQIDTCTQRLKDALSSEEYIRAQQLQDGLLSTKIYRQLLMPLLIKSKNLLKKIYYKIRRK